MPSRHTPIDTPPPNAEPRADVTIWLRRWTAGDAAVEDDLMAALYPELRRIAACHAMGERPDGTLTPTALVNEAYLRLIQLRRIAWQDRKHFLAFASRVIRRVLVEHARRANALKRGGPSAPTGLDRVDPVRERPTHLLALDQALSDLERYDPEQARIVHYRYFGGLTGEEIGSLLGCSASTVKRQWRLARAWLYGELTPPAVGELAETRHRPRVAQTS